MFGLTYEDYTIEEKTIKKYFNCPIEKGLMILSGGETMFEIASSFKELIAVDFNQQQLDLVNEKISLMNTEKYVTYLSTINFAFDNLFNRIKNGESFEYVFELNNLVNNFGQGAIGSTTKNFAKHFENVFNKKGIYHDWIFDRNFKTKDKIYDLESIKKVIIINKNFNEMLEQEYDFIQTSNLTDWLSPDEFVQFCEKIKQALKVGGVFIGRRMLSNNILCDQFEGCKTVYDQTGIYEETIIWQKL